MAEVNRARRRGRPPRAAGEAGLNRQRILAAATAEFTRSGFGGARINEIARQADTNKRMLYHYFGGKDGLYVAVLEHVYASFRAAERKLKIDKLAPAPGLRRLIEFTFDYCAEHPELIALLNDENLYKGRHLQRSPHVPALYSPLIETIRALLDRGREAGVFRTGIDPMRLYISIASLSYFYFSNIHTLSAVFDRNFAEPGERRVHRRHVADLILRALRLDSAGAAGRK